MEITLNTMAPCMASEAGSGNTLHFSRQIAADAAVRDTLNSSSPGSKVLRRVLESYYRYLVQGKAAEGLPHSEILARLETTKHAQEKEFKKLVFLVPLLDQLIKTIRADYQLPQKPVENWRPQMTSEEAKQWARHSSFQHEVYVISDASEMKGVTKEGFNPHYTRYGFLGHLTPFPFVIWRLWEHRKCNDIGALNEYSKKLNTPMILKMRLNSRHPLIRCEEFEQKYEKLVQPILDGLSLPLVSVHPNREIRIKRRLIYQELLREAGADAMIRDHEFMATYVKSKKPEFNRENTIRNGEVILINPRAVTTIEVLSPERFMWSLTPAISPEQVDETLKKSRKQEPQK